MLFHHIISVYRWIRTNQNYSRRKTLVLNEKYTVIIEWARKHRAVSGFQTEIRI